MKIKVLLLFALLTMQQLSYSQYIFVATVRDSANQETLAGASLVEKGTTHGCSADMNGKAKLSFSKKGQYEIVLGFIGYISKNMIVDIPQRDSLLVVYLQSNTEELGEIIISSVRTNSTIENNPTKIEVLGFEEVNEENGIKPGNIMSMLSDMGGIQMQQVSASSGNTYARIQGLNGRYTQILRDGLPLFGGMSAGFSIMQIPPLDLKQIEIIKGCVSTLYGADAIGGIINLISKTPPTSQELSLTLNQTTLSETNFNLYAARRYKKFGYTLFFGQTLQKQMDVDNDSMSDVPMVNSTVIHPKLFFYFNPKSTLTLNYTATIDHREGGDMSYFTKGASDTLYHVTNSAQRHSADAKWMYAFSEKSNLSLKFSYNNLDENLSTKDYKFKGSQQLYYSEISFYKSQPKTDWVMGLNYNGDIFNNRSNELIEVLNYDYSTMGVFLQNTWRITDKFLIESGFREDYHSKYGFFALPRLSLMCKINKQFTTRINGGLGYKTPVQFSYIEPETDLKSLISAQLKPELSQGANADINYQHFFKEKVSITINQSFFLTKIDKPVYDSSSVSTKIALVNARKSLVTDGLQTYIRLNYCDLEIYLGYVYTNVVQNYVPLHKTPYTTPKQQLSSTFFYDVNAHLRFGIEASYIANQLNQDYHPTKDYFLMAAMIGYNIGSLSFVLNGENLLDFRQSTYERIYDGTTYKPVFHKLWAPIDGRVINFSVRWSIQ